MNACEDESEPLGEWSELPRITATVQLAERQALAEIRACIENYSYSGVSRRIKQILDEMGV